MKLRLDRVVTAAFAAFVLLSFSAQAGQAAGTVRPLNQRGHFFTYPPASVATVIAEGGTLASLVYRGWMDYFGIAVPGDSQLGPGGQPLDSGVQLLYGAVGTGGTQNDWVNQQSGWNGTTPAIPPNDNGSAIYNGSADTFFTSCGNAPNNITSCGYQPAAGAALETRGGTTQNGNSTTPDSMTLGGGDAPLNLAHLATFNNSNGQASGYNLQRGPALHIPAMGTAISVTFNPTNLTIPQGGVNLSRNSICGIFQGLITNWDDPSITSDNGGQVIGNQPITIVHRSDGSGTTFIFSFDLYVICAQSNVNLAYRWMQGVGTGSQNGGSPKDNTVTWPTTSLGEKGNGAVADTIHNTTGAIGYLSPSFVQRAGGYEAYVQNNAGNFVQATVNGTKAAINNGPFVKSSQTNEIPPGYPFIKDTYIPLPTNSGASPIVGYTFLYLYPCNPSRLQSQISQLQNFLGWAFTLQTNNVLTPADLIAEENGLIELPNKSPKDGGASKQEERAALTQMAAFNGSRSGTYIDPTTGSTRNYTCKPLQ